MQEKQVTIGSETFKLDDPFLVLATQNPIEQEGTYPLPEAQVDRFMLKLNVDYPSKSEEREILDRMALTDTSIKVDSVLKPGDIKRLRSVVDQIYIDDKIKDYIVDFYVNSLNLELHPGQPFTSLLRQKLILFSKAEVMLLHKM